jgi:hypothetical protein
MKVKVEEVKELWFDAVPISTDNDSDLDVSKIFIECCVYASFPDFKDRDRIFCVFDSEKWSKLSMTAAWGTIPT